jgi:hypothetical protein
MPTSLSVYLEVPSLDHAAGLDDLSLIAATKSWAEARRIVDAGLATLAGIVAARSTLELGYDGLAQRSGLRTADALISQLTGTSGPEARAITAVGTMLDSPQPWLGEVAGRVLAGSSPLRPPPRFRTDWDRPPPPLQPTIWPTLPTSCSPAPARCRPKKSPVVRASSATSSTRPG